MRFDEQLVVVGTGIRALGQMTVESLAWIRHADRVVYVVSDPIGQQLLHSLNPRCESLTWMYGAERPRMDTYQQMVERTLELVRGGEKVCFVTYGHPGVFAWAPHESVRRARAEGFRARMLPGISAEDCLYADLGIDPGSGGCQSYEASDFMLNDRRLDPSSHVVLWQVGILGEQRGVLYGARPRGLPELFARLVAQGYPEDHGAFLYEASLVPGVDAKVIPIQLDALDGAPLTLMTTLYVPPAREPVPNWELAESLGFERPAEAR